MTGKASDDLVATFLGPSLNLGQGETLGTGVTPSPTLCA